MEDLSILYPQETNNGLNMDDYSQFQSNINPSTFNNFPNSTFTINSSETAYINRVIGENDFPYPNINNIEEKRDIPIIEIKDERFFMNDELIEDYLKNIKEVEESQFNTCRKCFKYTNKYFCKDCDRNLCEDCSKDCRNKKHNLIDLLMAKQGDILTARKDVTRLIEKRFKEDEENKSKVKSQKSNLNKSKIGEQQEKIKENIENYSRKNDFLLIARIVLKDYINYYHYENILSCYRYMANRFLHTLDKNCLKIIYEVEKENKEIKIFHPNFVEKNKDKLTLIINNEPSELIDKVTVDEDYLEVILVQKSKDDYITDLSYMFCGCTNLIGVKEHLDHKLIDFRNVEDISYMFKYCVKIPKIDFNLFKNLFWTNKMDNLFYECKELIEIKGFLHISDETLKNNIFYGCEKLKIKINKNNISVNSDKNDDIIITLNDKNLLLNENNLIKESSHSMEYNNQASEIKKESKAQFESSESNYQEIQKNNGNSKTNNFENAFETAINIENIPELYLAIKNYYLWHKGGKNLSKNILEKIMRILCKGITSCENLVIVAKFIIRNICEKNIYFDKELNQTIYESFLELFNNKEALNLLNINENDISKIMNFFAGKFKE